MKMAAAFPLAKILPEQHWTENRIPGFVSSQRATYRVFKSENIQDILAQWQTRNQTPLSKWAQNHQTHVYTFLSQNLCVWITSVCHAVFLLGPTCLPLWVTSLER